ncbi:MAG: UbiA family prenyltransferase [Deltaproteobacteria bacterium]|nr:UbiA family prenyltransferase [Deltaproteobacteria bacterium]
MDTPVLAVDLDGTYILGDVTEEAWIELFKSEPLKAILAIFIFLCGGNLAFKKYLARNVDVSSFFYNHPSEFYDFLRQEKAKGRKIILISASPQEFVEVFKGDIFDEAIGSTSTNLKGFRKTKVLKRLYQTFDYVGNTSVDFYVFEAARTPILVNARPSLIQKFKDQFPHGIVFSPRPPLVSSVYQLLRIPHWFKNGLLFCPAILAHEFSITALANLFFAFVLFGLMSSGNYILNDLFDIHVDRQHSKKKFRPLASNQISCFFGVALAFLLILTSMSISFLFSPVLALFLLIYLLIAILYSRVLKKLEILDIFTLTLLYIIRLFAGAFLVSVPITGWFVTFFIFAFLSLASVKRASELIIQGNSIGRKYFETDIHFLQTFGLASGLLSTLVFLLYLNSEAVKNLYSSPEFLWMIFPLLVYWYATIWLKVCRGQSLEDPVVFLITSKVNWTLLLIFSVLFWLSVSL